MIISPYTFPFTPMPNDGDIYNHSSWDATWSNLYNKNTALKVSSLFEKKDFTNAVLPNSSSFTTVSSINVALPSSVYINKLVLRAHASFNTAYLFSDVNSGAGNYVMADMGLYFDSQRFVSGSFGSPGDSTHNNHITTELVASNTYNYPLTSSSISISLQHLITKDSGGTSGAQINARRGVTSGQLAVFADIFWRNA